LLARIPPPARAMANGLAVLVLVLLCVVLRPTEAGAQRLSLIRDAEIEHTIRAFSTPLFRAAGLNASAVRIYLINDRSLNAFVAGGQKLFLNTGLLIRSEHAGQVIGVIAHETGHIEGGHLSRTHDAMRNATAQTILGLLLGGAAAAAGRPDVGAAVIAGGQSASLRTFLQYSRTQEAAADQAAMRLLEDTGQSARGLLEFLGTLSGQELLTVGRQDPYLRTHPLTRERILALEDFISRSKFADRAIIPEFVEMHARMRAKLIAFLESPQAALRAYSPDDQSIPARYARAIAYYRTPDLEKALPLVDGLIAERPEDPFFHELKGQMLFENGRVTEALAPYERAVELAPTQPLIRTDLARVQLALNDPTMLELAILNLRSGLRHERGRSFAWRQLAIAYGRNGQMGESALALAEEAVLLGNRKDAQFHAGKAERLLPKGSPGWLKAQDIRRQAEGAK